MRTFKRLGPQTFSVSNGVYAVRAHYDESYETPDYYGKLVMTFYGPAGAVIERREIKTDAHTPLDQYYAVERAFAFLDEMLSRAASVQTLNKS